MPVLATTDSTEYAGSIVQGASMIKILSTGMSAVVETGMNATRRRRAGTRSGEASKDNRFDCGSAILETTLKDHRIEAVLEAQSDVWVRCVSLVLRFRSPRNAGETAIWTESYSGLLDHRQAADIPGSLTTRRSRDGAWAMWIGETAEAEGILLGMAPPLRQPLSFHCSPKKGQLIITWRLNRSFGAGERRLLVNVEMRRGFWSDAVGAWVRQWDISNGRPSAEGRVHGWLLGDEVDSPRVLREQLSVIKAGRAGTEWCALGPGYAVRTGDWSNPKDAFRDRMGSASRSIGEQSLIPGLRIAPFLVSRRSSMAAEHPDWFVRNGGGSPLQTENSGVDDERCLVLDVTHPGVQAHLKKIFSILRDQWGFRCFVLDRLDAAALPGSRSDGTLEAGSLMDGAGELIREAVGPRVLLVARDVPLLASVGHYDIRCVAAARDPKKLGSRRGRGLHGVLAAALLHRARWNRRSWLNSSGALPVGFFREEPVTGVRSLATAAALSAGAFILQGDPRELDEQAWNRIRRTMELFDDCRHGRLDLSTDAETDRRHPLVVRNDRGWIALFNFSNQRRQVHLDRDRLRKTFKVTAALSAGDQVVFNSPEIHVALLPRGFRLFRG